ncbi:hypothetical protein [Cohnella sp. REN36]|uniref:hypothetical protein n=1 Tax=Cohnella sp. REN36 TaxID=2887347 RepID=UPI001D13EBDA|nr:hypothetical protein [Cohnella sp. REN36]MCC3377157.1 hypothetical protein [Cohnella sp. REN36]
MSSLKTEITEYRDIADRVGGDDGKKLHELIDAFEQLRDIKLLGATDVANRLGIDPRNMGHKRKTKYFPNSVARSGKFEFWLEHDIVEYIENIKIWRERNR